MKQQSSSNLTIGYYLIAFLVVGFLYIAFTDTLCSVMTWLADTAQAHVSAIKN